MDVRRLPVVKLLDELFIRCEFKSYEDIEEIFTFVFPVLHI